MAPLETHNMRGLVNRAVAPSPSADPAEKAVPASVWTIQLLALDGPAVALPASRIWRKVGPFASLTKRRPRDGEATPNGVLKVAKSPVPSAVPAEPVPPMLTTSPV